MNKVLAHKRIIDLVGDFNNQKIETTDLYIKVWGILQDLITTYAEYDEYVATNYAEGEPF